MCVHVRASVSVRAQCVCVCVCACARARACGVCEREGGGLRGYGRMKNAAANDDIRE